MPDLAKVRATHAKRIEQLELELAAVAVVLDERGNRLADLIDQHRAAWAKALNRARTRGNAPTSTRSKPSENAADLAAMFGAVEWLNGTT